MGQRLSVEDLRSRVQEDLGLSGCYPCFSVSRNAGTFARCATDDTFLARLPPSTCRSCTLTDKVMVKVLLKQSLEDVMPKVFRVQRHTSQSDAAIPALEQHLNELVGVTPDTERPSGDSSFNLRSPLSPRSPSSPMASTLFMGRGLSMGRMEIASITRKDDRGIIPVLVWGEDKGVNVSEDVARLQRFVAHFCSDLWRTEDTPPSGTESPRGGDPETGPATIPRDVLFFGDLEQDEINQTSGEPEAEGEEDIERDWGREPPSTAIGDDDAHVGHSLEEKSLFDKTEPNTNNGVHHRRYRSEPVGSEKFSFSLPTRLARALNGEGLGKQSSQESQHPSDARIACRHPNFPRLINLVETGNAFYFILEFHQYTLENILKFSRDLLATDMQRKFCLFQILKALSFCHSRGIVHGNLSPSHILVSEQMWCYVTGLECPSIPRPAPKGEEGDDETMQSLAMKWSRGEISSFDYLMALNRRAGRQIGDGSFHPVLPWVIDFTDPEGGWRDLSKTKFRLCKGDEQLDITYDGPNPHHITESLSEVTYYIYMARRTPIEILRRFVRANYEPNEYPSSIQRIYEWTPDECIPELFTDPNVFRSIHEDMPDLALPDWCDSPEQFIKKHRAALESDEVSGSLHKWIDLTFGYKLTGDAAITAKNVPMNDNQTIPRNKGFVQLFTRPHPRRGYRHDPPDVTTVSPSHRHVEPRTPSTALPVPVRDGASPLVGSSGSTSTRLAKLLSWGESKSPKAVRVRTRSDTTQKDEVGLGTLSEQGKRTKEIFSLLRGETRERAATGSAENYAYTVNMPLTASNEDFLGNLKYIEESTEFSARFGHPVACYSAPLTGHNEMSAFDWLRAADMFAFGCTMAELYIGVPVFNARTLKMYERGQGLMTLSMMSSSLRSVVNSLLSTKPRERPSADELIRSHIFPRYFEEIYKFLSGFHEQSSWNNRLEYTLQSLPDVMDLPEEAFLSLVLPHCLPFFSHPETKASSLSLVEPLGAKLGQVESRMYLLSPLIKLYQSVAPPFPIVELSRESMALNMALLHIGFLHSFILRLGQPCFLDHMLPSLIDMLRHPCETVAHQASKSLILLTYMLTPTITINMLVRPLLRKLGKPRSASIVNTLVGVGLCLGESIVVEHHIPYLLSQLAPSVLPGPQKGKRTDTQLANVLMCLEGLLNVLTPTNALRLFLVEYNQLVRMLLNPSPYGPSVLQHISSTLCRVAVRIGPDNTRKHILPHINMFFSNYDDFYSRDGMKKFSIGERPGRSGEEDVRALYSVYSPELALSLWRGLSSVVGRTSLRSEIGNTELIEKILLSNCQVQEFGNESPVRMGMDPWKETEGDHNWFTRDRRHGEDMGSPFNIAARSRGPNRALVLSDDWILKADVRHSFKAHTGGIRAIDAHENESFFVTGSKDGLVKCWRLEQAKCQLSYDGHKEPVTAVNLLDGGRRVASCDHSVHIWDPESGRRLFRIGDSSTILCMYPFVHQQVLVLGTSENTLRFIDHNAGTHMYEYRLYPSLSGSLRSLAASPDRTWLAAAYNTGMITLLDQRTGLLHESWKAHDGGILHIEPYGDNHLLSAGPDKCIHLWNVKTYPPTIVKSYGGLTHETLSCFKQHKKELIVGLGDRIGVSNLEEESTVVRTSAKLIHKAQTKSKISAILILPHNRLVLVGSEDGQVKFCE